MEMKWKPILDGILEECNGNFPLLVSTTIEIQWAIYRRKTCDFPFTARIRLNMMGNTECKLHYFKIELRLINHGT